MEQKQDEEIVAGALRVLALILGEHVVQVPTGDKNKTCVCVCACVCVVYHVRGAREIHARCAMRERASRCLQH
jgi:hypothetical protein